MLRLIAVISLIFASLQLATAQGTIKPYIAEYELKRSLLRAMLDISLSFDTESNTYTYQSEGEPKGLAGALTNRKLSDSTRFKLDDGTVIPLQYAIGNGGKDDSGGLTADFDWQEMLVKIVNSEESKEHVLEPGMHSISTFDFNMRLALLNGNTVESSAIIIDKGGPRKYEVQILGEEELKTALGKLKTIKYQSSREGSPRATIQWLAADLENLPVRVIQTKDGKTTYTMEIKSYQAQ